MDIMTTLKTEHVICNVILKLYYDLFIFDQIVAHNLITSLKSLGLSQAHPNLTHDSPHQRILKKKPEPDPQAHTKRSKIELRNNFHNLPP